MRSASGIAVTASRFPLCNQLSARCFFVTHTHVFTRRIGYCSGMLRFTTRNLVVAASDQDKCLAKFSAPTVPELLRHMHLLEVRSFCRLRAFRSVHGF
jgi:hypothetical protein